MGSTFVFFYTLLGVGGIWGLLTLARRQKSKLRPRAWVAAAVWYIGVGMTLSFTLINLDGGHARAATIGAVITLLTVAILGLIVYRLAFSAGLRRTA